MSFIGSTPVVKIEFVISGAEQLHLFAQYMEEHPDTDLEHMSKKQWLECIKSVLYNRGFEAVKAHLPDVVELKKFDYRASLKGVVDV